MTVSLKDVVEKMSTESCSSTLGWDVVVNYTESELNTFLKHSFEYSKTCVKDIKLDVVAYDQAENPYTALNVVLAIGPPSITLTCSGEEPSCTMTLPINGGFCLSSNDPGVHDIYAGSYEIKLMNLSIASMSGVAGSPPSSDNAAVFRPANGDAAITMDFLPSGALAVRLDVCDAVVQKHPLIEAHKAGLEFALFRHFVNPEVVSSIQYQIATSTPPTAPTGCLHLHPRAFRFAAIRASKPERSVLSIFIETVEGVGSGLQIDLQKEWQAKWGSWGVTPVPDSHTMSIIFNQALISKRVVLPVLLKAGLTASEPTFEKDKGHKYTVSTHKKVQRDGWQDGAFFIRTMGKIDVDLDNADKLLYVELGQNSNSDASASASFYCSFEYELEYSTMALSTEGMSPTEYGHATIKNSLWKVCPFEKSPSDYTVELKAGFQAGWNVDVSPKDDNNLWSNSFSQDVPEMLHDILPSVAFSGEFYFFAVTNIFAPGQHVIDIDAATGLRIPRDYYLVGKVRV